MIPPPCDHNHFTDRGDIWGFNSKRIKTAFHWSEYSVNVADLQTNTAVDWGKSSHQFPYWVQSSPFRTILHWWMEQNNAQLLHAAAVGVNGNAILLTGKGGAGKSTTALSCLNSGMDYYADDYLIVKIEKGRAVVYSLYSTGKLNRHTDIHFPDFDAFASCHVEEDQEKEVFYFYPGLQKQIKSAAPLTAILEPQIKGEKRSSFSSISQWQMPRALSFTTMSQLPGVGPRTHNFIHNLSKSVPCYVFHPGTDMEEVPETLKKFIQHPDKFATKELKSSKKELPLISVIIPVFNGERFIASAIENVVAQKYPAIEIIVVDDGSEDNTAEIVNGFPYDIRYFKQENFGPAVARNRGIKDASGSYLAFLDADDLWPEGQLSMLADILENHPETDVVRGYAQLFNNNEHDEMIYQGDPGESYRYYIGGGLYRKSVFERVGLFDRTLFFGEDTDWYYRAREENTEILWLDDITLYVRRHGDNMTEGKNILELNKLKSFKKVLDRDRSRKPGEQIIKKLEV
jgi:GT2 family glycosyltransferase